MEKFLCQVLLKPTKISKQSDYGHPSEPLTPAINALIRVFTPQTKTAFSWTVAKVVGIRGNQIIVEQKGIPKTVSI